MGINRSLRFRILARDNFTCQYCGRKPPDVVLELDHMIPRSKGGRDHWTNLITACYDCNHGKFATLLSAEQVEAIVQRISALEPPPRPKPVRQAARRDRVVVVRPTRPQPELTRYWCPVCRDIEVDRQGQYCSPACYHNARWEADGIPPPWVMNREPTYYCPECNCEVDDYEEYCEDCRGLFYCYECGDELPEPGEDCPVCEAARVANPPKPFGPITIMRLVNP